MTKFPKMESKPVFCFLCQSFPSNSQEDLQLHFIDVHSNFFLPKPEPIVHTELELDDNISIDDDFLSGFVEDIDVESDFSNR